jgi:hypothetical protein
MAHQQQENKVTMIVPAQMPSNAISEETMHGTDGT